MQTNSHNTLKPNKLLRPVVSSNSLFYKYLHRPIRVDRRRYPRVSASKGFTYIELLITLAIIAVLFIPMMQLFSHSLRATVASQDLITATNLAKWGMERVKNLNMTKAQLREVGDLIYPPLEDEPLEMNNAKWRVRRVVLKETDPLEVRVFTFLDGEPDRPVVTLVTLIEDMVWEEFSPTK